MLVAGLLVFLAWSVSDGCITGKRGMGRPLPQIRCGHLSSPVKWASRGWGFLGAEELASGQGMESAAWSLVPEEQGPAGLALWPW